MEGNECYKFSTIRNYIRTTGAPRVDLAIDIGANVGNISSMITRYFPEASIYSCEPVDEYYGILVRNVAHNPNIHPLHAAITSADRFADPFGLQPMARKLIILKGQPCSGPGWMGGSIVGPVMSTQDCANKIPQPYLPEALNAKVMSLDDLVDFVLLKEGKKEVDIVKMDCEGCEHYALGCADTETLRKIRFIVGEYHCVKTFFKVLEHKVFKTHAVNLIGDAHLGAFFAERIGQNRTILNPSRAGMSQLRPWLCDIPIEWNIFREEFVTPAERSFHAM